MVKKIFVHEKSKKNIDKIKRLRLSVVFINRLEDAISQSEFIIVCTPMSEYKKIILKMNKHLKPKHIITDLGSSKIKSEKIIQDNLKKDIFWTSSHPIAGSEVSGPENGKHNLFENKWCVLIKEKNSKKNNITKLSNF